MSLPRYGFDMPEAADSTPEQAAERDRALAEANAQIARLRELEERVKRERAAARAAVRAIWLRYGSQDRGARGPDTVRRLAEALGLDYSTFYQWARRASDPADGDPGHLGQSGQLDKPAG